MDKRIDINLNNDWLYHIGDYPDIELTNMNLNDSTSVNLPHNTSLYTETNKDAYLGVSWYKKELYIDSSYMSKRLLITFEGIMQHSDIYLNGVHLQTHTHGYTPFIVDISNAVIYGKPNILCVKADSTPNPDLTPGKSNPDFQYFGGIYRNVTLTITNKIYISSSIEENIIAGGGIFVTTPTVTKENALIKYKVHIKNDTLSSSDIKLSADILFKGEKSADTICIEKSIKGNDSSVFTGEFLINSPHLWHPYTPDLYTLKLSVYANGVLIDHSELFCGVRKIVWSHEGLYINDERFFARGANLHSDIFDIGNAIPDNEVYEEIKRFKENGFDFVRMSHYPHSKAYYDACDKYGVLVLDCLTGWQNYSDTDSFKESTYSELRCNIRYLRNHPSIIAWETSLNESNYTEDWAKTVHDIAHTEYPTENTSRMWTTGWKTDIFDILLGAGQHDIRNIADHSNKGVIISEHGDWDYGGTYSTSRQKRESSDSDMLIQVDNYIESCTLTSDKSWFCADSLWAYAEYAGFDENINFGGTTDRYRLNKFSSYFFKSQRTPSLDMNSYGLKIEPVIYIANTCTLNSPKDITIFSNCDKVELFVDNISCGLKGHDTMHYGPNSQKMISIKSLAYPPITFTQKEIEFYTNIPCTNYTLTAIGYLNGEKICKHQIKTPNKPNKIILSPESSLPLDANGSDIKLIWLNIVDVNGTIVPNYNKHVNVSITGGYILGNEDIVTKGGQIGFWIRADRSINDNIINILATCDELTSEKLVLKTNGISDIDIPQLKDVNEYNYFKTIKNISILKDIAREKPAYASSCKDGTTASMGNNGEPSTFWYPHETTTNWWYVDTQDNYYIDRVEINWDNLGVHSFLIEISLDTITWMPVLDKTSSDVKESQSIGKIEKTARYVRISLQSKDVLQGFNMFYVYGKKL